MKNKKNLKIRYSPDNIALLYFSMKQTSNGKSSKYCWYAFVVVIF